MFPDTPQTLLKKIAELAKGDDAAEWAAFVELYAQPLRNFIHAVNGSLSAEDVDDAVQEVFVRLVDVLRAGKIDRTKAKFRAYLAALVRRLLIDRYREALVRPQGVPLNEDAADDMAGANSVGLDDPGLVFDAKWRLAVHRSAVEHVLTQTAVSKQSAAIYRALEGMIPELRNSTSKEIAAHFGVSADVVKQVHSRLGRAIAAVESRLID